MWVWAGRRSVVCRASCRRRGVGLALCWGEEEEEGATWLEKGDLRSRGCR